MTAAGSVERRTRTLEFGIYRDGDNNLDDVQARVLNQALETSAADRRVEFTVEDTTKREGFGPPDGALRTFTYVLRDGTMSGRMDVSAPHDMASRANLARFVALTLDQAQRSHATQTWIDLVDHGAGDGGGLEADAYRGVMREDDMAAAIADGVALHAAAHTEDAGRRVDGVVANQCLMATLGFASALSHAGVRYLAASPETMLAPGVPSGVAADIERHPNDPAAMAKAVVDRVMTTEYGSAAHPFGPAAAFDVLDLDAEKIGHMESGVAALNAALGSAAQDRSARAIVREDARAIDGMVRFPHSAGMPWHADRPALALYDTLAHDGRLGAAVRSAAQNAVAGVRALVLAHDESDGFAPFGGSDYSDAVGPTVHFPVTPRQVDAWAPAISETDNAFYRRVGGAALAGVLA
ncbi:MAG: hypothetical protein GIW95_12615 [Candidatus Eremiobacteraeota bacterium]|nr:hypothetical protein [Candidatus Eremiobacteraeota bacterium]